MLRRNTIFGVLLLLLAALLGGAARSSPSIQAFEEGLTLEREIRGGEIHSYPVDLQEGQYLRVVVQEKGIDLAARLVGPDGKVATGVDSLSYSPHCREDLAAVAKFPGQHRLELASSGKAAPGRYKLSVQDLRTTVGEQDRLRAEAVLSSWEAFHPSGQGGRIPSLERARELWEQLGERRNQATALFQLGEAYNQLPGAAEKAAEAFRQSALLWEGQAESEAKIWHLDTLNSAGNLLKQIRRTEEARKHFEQAVKVSREAGNQAKEAISLNNLGLLEVENGEIQEGLSNLLLAQERARAAGTERPRPYINIGYAYELLNERQKAIQSYDKALELARKNGDRETEANALNNLGDSRYFLGDLEGALRYFQQALELNRALGDRPKEARTLNNLGAVYVRLERYKDAEQVLEQARQLSREVEDGETETRALTNRAELLIRQKRPVEAIEAGRQVLSQASGFWAAEADARQILGMAYREQGDLQKAREELELAASLARARGDIEREADCMLSLARTNRKAGDLEAALSRVRQATTRIESLRARVVNPELRAMFLASKQDYYEFQIDTLMTLHAANPQKGFAAEALQVSEQARARSLLEILQESEADIREGIPPSLLEKERRLRAEVNAREGRRLDLLSRRELDAGALAEAETRLEQAREEYQKVQDELRSSSPRYDALIQPHPVSVQEIREQLLDGQALLLEYKLGRDRSFLWAVSPDSMESFELPAREEIEKVARRWYDLLTARNPRPGESLQARNKRIQDADADAEQVARELSRMVLGPVEGRLGNRPLLVVAEGTLQYVPFAALPLPLSGVLLVERNEVISLPSASTLAVLRRDRSGSPRAPKLLAVLADPVFQKDDERLAPAIPARSTNLAGSGSRDAGILEGRASGIDLPSLRRLPYSLKEAQAISSLAPKDQVFLATGFDATLTAATSPDLARYRNVHFATHGVLDSRRPELSGLVFSLFDGRGEKREGILRLNDIYNLRLEADLVTLSACRTALGKEIRGEGLVGLTRGFMYAGAARVLASLWSIEDRSTADLMSDFYRGMLSEKLSPSAALRKAQLKMAKNPHRKSPYFWAGFSLQGEWK